MARRGISADRDTVNELSSEANRRKKTLYSFTNECLKTVLAICQDGGSPEEALAAWGVNKVTRGLGSMPFLPMGLVDSMVTQLHVSGEDKLYGMWLDAGKTLGTFLKNEFPTYEELVRFNAMVALSLQGRRLRFVKEDERDDYLFEGIYPRFSKVATACMANLHEGILSIYSFKVTERNLAEGVFIFRAKKLA